MSSERRGQAEGDLKYAGEKLIEDTWGWLVARPQRTDANAWLKTLGEYLDARDQVKSLKEGSLGGMDMECEHGEWYVGNGNMVCGRGCERLASDIISELTSQVMELERTRPSWPDLGPDRDILGRVVRDVWIEWCRRKQAAGLEVRPSNLLPWEEMEEGDREVDRLIGEALFRAGARYIIDTTKDYAIGRSDPSTV